MALQMVLPDGDTLFYDQKIFCWRCCTSEKFEDACFMGWFHDPKGGMFKAYLCPLCAQATMNETLKLSH